MPLKLLTPTTIKPFFDPESLKKGIKYFNENRVNQLSIDYFQEDIVLEATVTGNMIYQVGITLVKKKNTLDIGGYCYCPGSYCCKHMVAVLYKTMQQVNCQFKSDEELSETQAQYWLQDLETTIKSLEKSSQSDTSYELYFQFNFPNAKSDLVCEVEPTFFRRLKSGKLGAQKIYSFANTNTTKHLIGNEEALLNTLELMNFNPGRYYRYRGYDLKGKIGQQLILDLLASNKCILKNEAENPIGLGDSVKLDSQWKTDPKGNQKLQFNIGIKKPIFFYIDSLWYFDAQNNKVGQVQTELSKEILLRLFDAPEIPASFTAKLNNFMHKQVKLTALPRLNQTLPKEVKACKPIPKLQLRMATIDQFEWRSGVRHLSKKTIAVAELSFLYEEVEVSWQDQQTIVVQEKEEQAHKMARDFDFESASLASLHNYALQTIETNQLIFKDNQELGPLFYFAETNPLNFSKTALPDLQSKGWVIQISEDYAYRVINTNSEETEWFAKVTEEESSDWFSLELGFTLEGQKVNLLPTIQHLLSTLKSAANIDHLKEQDIFVPLANGQFAAIPGERVYYIVDSLIELFDRKSLDDNQALKLYKSQAARLAEIEKASGAAALRWHGGEKTRALGKKIAEFKEIAIAPIPTGFMGTLRPYQHEGLSWLQFLREYELAGILADDMGLGKTIQALSHLLLEKESGRMTQPSLIIAPTSLMYNWEKEAMHFAPSLKTCLLHGPDRSKFFSNLADYDLILTTYPLILRDKEVLLKQGFHLLILDEAQYIKNSKNLATQVAIQLKAKHRLCLTGTPMENHLGELWSLYHFLMPGLLGDEKFFTKHFRTPIEKHSDNDRRKLLNRRLAPFILRRTKDSVEKDLPPKTEIVQYVELESKQRDLYESIRIAMEEKVRKEVEKLGLSRSHIVILDALLKLRQVCCDPQLLKMDTPVKKGAQSAKMELLADMIPELLEEGRRILLFSQFTEMLALIEIMLEKAKIPYVKLTGQTKDRKTVIEAFQAGKVPLFLISLKAGGTGLNLTAADTIIHFDPWWNPAVENQATDRAYRIGQDKPVFVYKIVTKGTVEEKIIMMQARKQALADSVYSDKSVADAKITEQDLQALFTPL